MARICIDPGHGGSDPGAIGPSGLQEKVVTLAVVKKLAYILKAAGAQVKLTWEDDSYVSLAERVAISNDFGADVFISIHANAATSPQAKGIEVWTTWGQTAADPLAESIANSLRAAFPGLVFRADMSDGDQDKEANFQVLYYTKAPAVLVELGFITNSTEEELLNSPDYQGQAGRAIAEGVSGNLGFSLPVSASFDETGEAIKVLQNAGVINSPEYWAEYARPGKQASGEFVGLLIQKMAKKIGG